MNYIFHELIGKIVEIYIDDVVIKPLNHESHLDNVRKTLECTRKHGLKMNPNKCALLPIGTKYCMFGKWSPNWEDPFRVVRCTPGNAYILKTLL
jgi:hypothetical protein